jgi:predicted permease
MKDIRLAFRTLFRTPFVTGIALLSLALGIGANAAIYSVLRELVLLPLPVPAPDRLVNLVAPGVKTGATSCNQAGDCDAIFSYPMYRDLEAASTPLTGLAAHRWFGANVAFDGRTVNGGAMYVSGSYFPVLEVRPALGRLLGPADDGAPGANPVAVLEHGFWQNVLGGDPNVIGGSIVVNGQPLTVVGVAPAGFHGTTLGARPLAFVPITMRGVLESGFTGFDDRKNYWIYTFGRLEPGATQEQAAAALNAAYRPIINEIEAPQHATLSEQAMTQFREKRVTVEEGRRGQSSIHGEAGPPLFLLLATAGMVLLIACANIANLLLARGAGRGLEMAVRLSLGASRRQVLRQLMTESVLLALLGGVGSLIVAQWTLAGIITLLPPEAAQLLDGSLSVPVILFAAALALGTGLLFGLFPALHSTRPDLIGTIRGTAGNVTATRGATRFRTGLVTAQIALSMMLLVVAALFVRSLINVSRAEVGLNPENVVAFGVSPALNGYDGERSALLFARLEEELAAMPGVTAASASSIAIIAGNNWSNDVSVEGFERAPDTNANASVNEISPNYFATLGIPLLRGRDFTTADSRDRAQVAIVNEAFVRRFGLGPDAVGKRMAFGSTTDLDIEIVGVVRDAAYSEVKDAVPPVYFIPWRQGERVGSLTFYLRTAVDPRDIMRAVPGVVATADPHLPVEDMKTLPQQIRERVATERVIGMLSAAFAGLATLLAAIGLYGVLAYSVARRTREIGIRMALGAGQGAVRMLVLRQVAVMLGVGFVIGVAAALGLGRLAESLLYGVDGTDPVAIAAAVLLLGAFAFAAGYLPARRASRVEPIAALRLE